MTFAAVVIEGGLPKPLDYSVPPSLNLQVGSRVRVPVRGKERTGVVVALKSKPAFPKVLPVAGLLDDGLPPDLLELADWIATYYCCPKSSVLRTLLPGSVRRQTAPKEQLAVSATSTKEELRKLCITLQEKAPAQARFLEAFLHTKGKPLLTALLETADAPRSAATSLQKKGFIDLASIPIDRSPLEDQEYFPTKPKTLNPEQANALTAITATLDSATFATHLLFGVTGSGKTEVYLQAISRALELDKGVIVLVPEIALTAQTLERFRSRFEGKIALLHHRLSDGERADSWRKIRKGEVQIVIGPRSALFSPLPNLGLIIVDEEHEATYKQSDSAPYYHGRDLAVMRGKLTNSTVVLGSATPSLESFHNAQNGKYTLLELPSRADNAHLASVDIVDMRSSQHPLLSDQLLTAIEKRFQVGEQSLIFLNRRGYHTSLLCPECGEAVGCPHCSVALTFHRDHRTCSCHLCGFELQVPRQCPSCKGAQPLKFRGAGTEQVERALNAIFPDIRTLRADADTTRHKGSHDRLLRSFRSGKADILVGTQMIAKGLHFPQVTLVGVLNADAALHIPDFRSSERVFQLITQVSGRAGRGQLPGQVVVQTRMPSHPIIAAAAAQDYPRFYEQEVASRKLFDYPPFTHLVKVTFSGEDERHVARAAEKAHASLKLEPPHDALSPTPSGYAKIKDKHRFQFLLRGPSVSHMTHALQHLPTEKGVRCNIDVDPTSTFF